MKRLITILFIVPLFCTAQRQTGVKLPITADMSWQLNTAISNSDTALFDGALANFNPGSNLALDTHRVKIELPFGWNAKITHIKFYDNNGSTESNPTYIYGIKQYTGEMVRLCTYLGTSFQAWVDSTVADTATFSKIVLQNNHVNDGNLDKWPAELEIWGDYTPVDLTQPTPVVIQQTFSNFMGINGYWFLVVNPGDLTQYLDDQVNHISKMKMWRSYMDWQRLQYPGDSTHFYYYDSVFKKLHDNGLYVTVTPQTVPQYLFEQWYPESMWPGIESDTTRALTVLTPAPWGSDWENPESFRKKAEFGFQLAARYGRNTSISESLRKSHTPDVWYIPKDSSVWGLGTVDAIEGGNEDDKDWTKDPVTGAFQKQYHMTGREMAAYLSAFYDGNKNTMGPGVGVKNADPTMKVVLNGLAVARNTDYMMAIRDWTIEHRGYKADGITPDYPFDEINYHLYSNDGGSQQFGTATRGQAPELSGFVGVMDMFQKWSAKYADNLPVAITESGFDVRNTVQRAIAIGAKSVEQTQGDWIARLSLLTWAKGMSRLVIYETFDNDTNQNNLTQYYSSGIFNSPGQVGPNVSNREAANFLIQLYKIIGDWKADSIVSTSPWIVRAKKAGVDSTAYVVWKGSEDGTTQNVTFDFDRAGKAYTLNYGSETATESPFNTGTGSYIVTAAETPQVVKVAGGGAPAEPPANSNRYRIKIKNVNHIKIRQ